MQKMIRKIKETETIERTDTNIYKRYKFRLKDQPFGDEEKKEIKDFIDEICIHEDATSLISIKIEIDSW